MHPSTLHGIGVESRSEVIQGHRFWYQSKACTHIPINGQQQLGPYLAPFPIYGGLSRSRQESSAKLTNQRVSYAFNSSPLSFHARHILPTSKFKHSYVAAKATYIRLLHGKIGILEGFFGPSSVHRGRTHIVLG